MYSECACALSWLHWNHVSVRPCWGFMLLVTLLLSANGIQNAMIIMIIINNFETRVDDGDRVWLAGLQADPSQSTHCVACLNECENTVECIKEKLLYTPGLAWFDLTLGILQIFPPYNLLITLQWRLSHKLQANPPHPSPPRVQPHLFLLYFSGCLLWNSVIFHEHYSYPPHVDPGKSKTGGKRAPTFNQPSQGGRFSSPALCQLLQIKRGKSIGCFMIDQNPFTRESWNPMSCTADVLLLTWRTVM